MHQPVYSVGHHNLLKTLEVEDISKHDLNVPFSSLFAVPVGRSSYSKLSATIPSSAFLLLGTVNET
ncbi:hypothetical protein E2C01_014153 [Portunus trituberculatus]|uniref:Uncharacterized protein n=1 Tax=Portunus trituberculatus TaxID=210409 RepID=A0A5B7DIE9_PORTR|nr:hypothetical protein [Portunus trituberculatus]